VLEHTFRIQVWTLILHPILSTTLQSTFQGLQSRFTGPWNAKMSAMDPSMPNGEPEQPHQSCRKELPGELERGGPGALAVTELLEPLLGPDQAAPSPANILPSWPPNFPQSHSEDLQVAPATAPSPVLAVPAITAVVIGPPAAPPSLLTDQIYSKNKYVCSFIFLPCRSPCRSCSPENFQACAHTNTAHLSWVEEADLPPCAELLPRANSFGKSEFDPMTDYRKHNINEYERYDKSFRHLPGLDPASPASPSARVEGVDQARMQCILRVLAQNAPELGIDVDEDKGVIAIDQDRYPLILDVD